MINELPSAPVSEKIVLSLMMGDPVKWVPRILGDGILADHFHLHGAAFAILMRRHRAGESLDFDVMVQDEWARGTLDSVGGTAGMTDIFTRAVGSSAAQYPNHLTRLREALARRRAVQASLKLAEVTDASDAEEVRDALAAALEGVTGALSTPAGMTSAKEAASIFCERLNAAYHNGELPGQSTGLDPIDLASGGVRSGEMWIIGAETSGGKSVLMLQIAAHVASRGKRVLVFSLEMMAPEIVGRLVSCYGRIPYGQITQPRTALKPTLGKIAAALDDIRGWQLWIDDRPKLSASKIEAECIRRRDTEGPIDLVVVDYLQLVDGERGRNESRQEEVSRISKSLKNLAKTLGCPVITASQLNDDGRIREARDPSFDADAVLLIAPDGIKAAKLRNAPRGQVLPLVLNGEMQRFDRRV
jgi:replicative DNA helicase